MNRYAVGTCWRSGCCFLDARHSCRLLGHLVSIDRRVANISLLRFCWASINISHRKLQINLGCHLSVSISETKMRSHIIVGIFLKLLKNVAVLKFWNAKETCLCHCFVPTMSLQSAANAGCQINSSYFFPWHSLSLFLLRYYSDANCT